MRQRGSKDEEVERFLRVSADLVTVGQSALRLKRPVDDVGSDVCVRREEGSRGGEGGKGRKRKRGACQRDDDLTRLSGVQKRVAFWLMDSR
jgi:hypothetical protein